MVGSEAADGAAGWAREIMDGRDGQDDQETGQGAPPPRERGGSMYVESGPERGVGVEE